MATELNQATFQLHSDLQAILNEFANGERMACELVEGLTDAEINWRPTNGSVWSIAQCLDHLANANTVYTSAMRPAVRRAKPVSVHRPIRPGWFGRYFIKSMDAPPSRKMKAPKKIIPAAYKAREEALAGFLSSHEEIRSLIGECNAIDLNRTRFKNPFIGIFRFTVGTGLLVLAAHDRRHLWQANEIRASLDS